MKQCLAILVVLAFIASSKTGLAQSGDKQTETKWCVAVHSVDFTKKRAKKVNFKYRWCDWDGDNCEDEFTPYTLAHKGSAYQIAILCFKARSRKKVRVEFDESFSDGYQRRGFSLKPSGFKLTRFRRFRLPNSGCIGSGSYHFDFRRNGLGLYSGRPRDIADKKCRWSLLRDVSYQRCIWSGTSFSGKITHCSDAIAKEQDEKRIAVAYANRAEAYRKKGKYDRAIADFDSAVELNPRYAWAFGSRGQAYRQKGEYDNAIADLTKAMEIDPKLNWVIAHRGEAYRRKGEYDKAIADLSKAIENDPKYSWAFASRGESYRQKKDYDKAIADFDRAIEINPKYAWALGGRGQAYRAKGELKKSIADLTKAIEINSNLNWAIASRGDAYRQSGEYDKAIADFDRAIKRDPKYTWAIVRRGVSYRVKGKFDKAIADLTTAIHQDPELSWAHANLGEAYRLQDNFDKAIAAFDTAIEHDPKYLWALIRRGEAYRQNGNFERALESFDRAIEVSPKSDWPVAWRGRAKFFEGRYKDAAADLERALGLSHNTYTMLFRYMALKKAGVPDAATDLENNADKLDDQSWPFMVIELFLGRVTKEEVLKAATDKSKRCEANYYAGEWHLMKGERDQASESFKVAVETCPPDFIERTGATAALKTLTP